MDESTQTHRNTTTGDAVASAGHDPAYLIFASLMRQHNNKGTQQQVYMQECVHVCRMSTIKSVTVTGLRDRR